MSAEHFGSKPSSSEQKQRPSCMTLKFIRETFGHIPFFGRNSGYRDQVQAVLVGAEDIKETEKALANSAAGTLRPLGRGLLEVVETGSEKVEPRVANSVCRFARRLIRKADELGVSEPQEEIRSKVAIDVEVDNRFLERRIPYEATLSPNFNRATLSLGEQVTVRMIDLMVDSFKDDPVLEEEVMEGGRMVADLHTLRSPEPMDVLHRVYTPNDCFAAIFVSTSEGDKDDGRIQDWGRRILKAVQQPVLDGDSVRGAVEMEAGRRLRDFVLAHHDVFGIELAGVKS